MSDEDKAKPRILIADDSRLVRASFVKYLSAEFDIQQCEDGQQALALLEEAGNFSLLFTDLSMPNMDGYTLLERIRNNENAWLRDLPVIIVTGKEDADQDKERILGLGATDLISKPFHSSELLSRARGYATLRKKVESLQHKVPVDPLTGLTTRDYFMEQGNKHFALARRQGLKLTVARFAIINLPELSHDFGAAMAAKMMTVVSKALQENMRTEDVAAYLGDGQFVMLLPGTDPQGTVHVWARLRSRIAKFELKVGDRKVVLNFATGISSQQIGEHIYGFEQLFNQAEESLHVSVNQDVKLPVLQANSAPDAEYDDSYSVDALLNKIRDSDIPEPRQMIMAMHALLPLLRMANKQLGLQWDDVIRDLVIRLAGTER